MMQHFKNDIAHVRLSDGRKVLRGSREEAVDMFGEELVRLVVDSNDS